LARRRALALFRPILGRASRPVAIQRDILPGVIEILSRLCGVGAKRGDLARAAKHLVHLSGV
jgi:hypothetical protein